MNGSGKAGKHGGNKMARTRPYRDDPGEGDEAELLSREYHDDDSSEEEFVLPAPRMR